MSISLLGAVEIREIAENLDLHPAKSLGQNFVIDGNTCQKIVRLAVISQGDHVVEIGPGLGSLTLALLQATDRVTAIEIDSRLATQLPLTAAEHGVPRGALDVINQDAMKVFDIPGNPTKLVANLPYNVSVPLLLELSWFKPKLPRDWRQNLEVRFMESPVQKRHGGVMLCLRTPFHVPFFGQFPTLIPRL